MKGKVIPLKLRPEASNRGQQQKCWDRIVEYVQPHAGEMEACLQREIKRSPQLIRDTLMGLLHQGDRQSPILFLTIAGQKRDERPQISRLAASLQALSLALQIHRCAEGSSEEDVMSSTESILTGDFFFSLALTLASEAPLFIKGMSEIIVRVVSSELNRPTRHVYFQAWRKAYLQRISDGYASIMALAGTLGAWYSGMQHWQNQALSYFSHYLGMGQKLQEEMLMFECRLQDRAVTPQLNLPLIYILEHSPRREELLAMLNRTRKVFPDQDMLKRESDRVNLEPYMQEVIGNCFGKADQFLELLRESIEPGAIPVLKSFMKIQRYYS